MFHSSVVYLRRDEHSNEFVLEAEGQVAKTNLHEISRFQKKKRQKLNPCNGQGKPNRIIRFRLTYLIESNDRRREEGKGGSIQKPFFLYRKTSRRIVEIDYFY